jgi:hypothetical protein
MGVKLPNRREWSYTSTPVCFFMKLCLIDVAGENATFTFSIRDVLIFLIETLSNWLKQ